MKVSELIELLKDHDPNLTVVVDAYEGGYDELEGVRSISVRTFDTGQFYYGDLWDGAD